jgi:hypothetical protein
MIREAIRVSFHQLLIIYTVLVFLAGIGIISSYTLHFEIIAVVLAVFGALIIEKKDDEIKIPIIFVVIPVAILLVFRIIPYLNNGVPLGYDPGIYKYIMETYSGNLPGLPGDNLELWVRNGFPPGLFVITDLLYLIGYDTHMILTGIFIFFELMLGLGIYAAAGRFFGREVGVLSLIIYSISIVQYQVFWYMYYKNVAALFVMLIALFLLKSGKYLPFIITASFVGALHRPTFLIFGLIYLAYMTIHRKEFVRNTLAGAVILALTLVFYIPNMKGAIVDNIEPIVTANIGAGTFISLFTYQFSSLSYLPFALLGFFIFIKRKDFNPFFLLFSISGIIVYFKLIFFNRFIIHLDVAMIVLAAIGFYDLIKSNKRMGTAVLSILFLTSLFVMNQNAIEAKPLISENELNNIEQLSSVESDAYVMSTSSYYSPWILGYSGRRTIAPGLFDYDRWSHEDWRAFWATGEKEKAVSMLEVYERPIYIYIGERNIVNETKFENECFDRIFQDERVKTYRVICGSVVQKV